MSPANRWLLVLPALLAWAAASEAHTARAASTPEGDGAGPSDVRPRADDLYAAGRAALARGETLAAMESFRAALRADPAMVAALQGMGVALDRVGRFDLARPYYETALALDPLAPDLLHNFALSLVLQGKDDNARPLLVKAAGMGDPAIRDSALALLARLDARAPSQSVQLAASPARPEAGTPSPADPTPPAAVAVSRQPNSVQLVRVGQGEWMLDRAPARPDARTEVAALAAVPEWTAADEAALAAREAAAQEAAAPAPQPPLALAAAQEPAMPPLPPLPPVQAIAPLLPLGIPEPGMPDAVPALALASGRDDQPDEAPARQTETLALPERRALLLRGSGHILLPVPRRSTDHPAIIGPVAALEPASGPSRRFQQPFASDDPRLNAFADRMLGRGRDSIGRQRTASAEEADRATLSALTAALWTAMPEAASPPARSRRPAFTSDDAALNAFAARLAG